MNLLATGAPPPPPLRWCAASARNSRILFLIELSFLDGRQKLKDYPSAHWSGY